MKVDSMITGKRCAWGRSMSAIFCSFLFAAPTVSRAADVDVLVVGDTRNYFSPTNVVTELRKILEGANLGTVNVVFEDMATAGGTYSAGNLLQWFYYPYPANVERTVRWPNLRGEAGTPWDYVVLIDDSYNLEEYPAFYAAGVASVAGEVSKGTAEPVLLMQWPKSTSTSTVAHYEEVVYRVGNSGSYKVAPAGLAWAAAGSPVTANQHPNSDGAYIAAATLYSTIWNTSATNSTYNPKPTLAQTAFNTFTNSLVTPHYTGKFNASSTNACGFYDLHPRRIVCEGAESSSENAVKGGFGAAMKLAGCTGSTLLDTLTVNTQRHPYIGAGSRIVYGFEIQTVDTVSGGQDEYCSSLDSDEYKMIVAQNNNYSYNTDVSRHLPTRMLYARIAQRYPNSAPFYANHIASHINSAMGSFAVTQLGGGGRSPMKPPEQVASEFDYCFQAGYELAWQFRHLHTRAPGFRFIPDSLTVGFTSPEIIRVKFYFPPKSNVTVTVTSAGPVTLENSTLTFTPENYNVAQEVRVLATPEAIPGSTFAVECITSSGDEVYDGIHDAWNYKVNRAPTSANIAVDAFAGKITPITLKGTDPDGEALTYQIVEPPKYGTVTITGPVASYTPDEGFTGSDSFTYKCNDSGDDSNVATVTITVMPQTPYNFNLLRNPSAELEPLADYGWVGDWYRVLGGTEGSWNFKGGKSLYQIVDISRYAERIARGDQSFSFSADLTCDGYVDRAGFTVECLNAAGKAVQTNSVAQYASFTYGTFSGTFLAPTNTASIRATMKGWTSTGDGARVRADRLKLVGLTPPNIAPVAYNQSGLVASAGIPNPVTLTSWDIDRDDLVYIIVNPPSHGTISGGTGAARFYTPNAGYEGPDSLTFKVFDREFNSNIATVSFDVVLNQSPRIVLDSPRTNSVQVPQNVDLLLRTTVWDDGLPNPLQCTWSKVSGVINGTNAIFTNPSEPITGINLMSGAGSGLYRLTVYDGAVTVTQDIEVVVSYDQERNIGAFIYRQESYAGTPGVPLTMLGARAADDGKPIPPGAFTYEFLKVAGTGNAVFDDATVESPTVTFDRAGSYVVRMIVNDGEVEDYNDIPVTITSAENLAPVADAVLLSPAAPKPGDTVTLSGAGSFDPNLDALTFSWVQTSGTGVTLSASDVMEPTFEVPDRGAYTFELTVSDGEFSSTTSVVVTVLNAPPVVDAGEHQTVYRVPGTLPWTPVGLAMAAWYDAEDTNTITASSGAVSQWNDKSGNGRNLSQATAAARPKTGTRTINGLNAIEFDGADDVLTRAANRTDAITIFGVVLVDSGSGDDASRSWLSAPAVDNPDYQMQAPANADSLGTTIRDAAGANRSGSRTASRNNAHIHAAYSWVPGGAAGGVRVDGGTPASLAASTSGLAMNASELAVGRQKLGYPTRFHDGLVAEVIIINRRLTETDNDFLKIEGYLAHKWNLAGNLPAGHPFKNAAPVTNAFTAVVSLDGTVSDPDPEDTVTTKWSVEGGNSRTVFLGDAAALDTTATFAQDGSYVLRLTADDGGSRPYDEVTISVYDAVPHITASEATGITDTRALLGGTLMLTGAAPVTVWCYWNPASDPGANPAGWLHSRSLGVAGATGALVNDTSATAALTPGTLYFYRYAAVNSYGTNWSDAASFVTYSPPVVANSGGDAGAESSATLHGVLAGGLVADAWICWGTSDAGTTSTGNWQQVVSAGAVTEGENFSVLVTGLSTNTIYFYRCYVRNAYGTGWSSAAGSFSGEPSADNPWTPTNITTAVWYDASDANTITASTNGVSQWRDKSGNAKHLNQATTTSQPRTGTRTINGLNAIEFDGSNDALTGAANRTDAITIFGVVLADSGSGTDGSRSWLSAPGGSNPDYWMMAPANADTLGAYVLDTTGSGSSASLTAVRNSAHIHAAYSWVPGGAAGGVRVDGGTPASLASKATGLQKLATELAIGRQKNVTGRFHDGLIGEVIIINRRLTEADDEFLKFEGYLAHKWGMTANLPDGHPYKKLTPWQGAIANLAPTGISELGATFNAALAAPGTNYTVSVYYGTTDGGTNAGSWASSAYVGTWSNVTTTISHSVGRLIPGQTYYCTFMASNAAGAVLASPSWQFVVPNGYDVCPLTVSTAHGTAVPAGETSQRSNSVVNVSIIDSPVYSGATQYVCTGWTGTGSATSGSGTNTSFTITTDTTVTWTWATNTLPTHTVVFDPGANGSRTGGGALTQQVIHGFSAVAPVITPATGYTFEGWDKALTNVTANLSINAQYALIPYTVTYLAGPNGSLSGTAIQTVLHGTSSTAVTAVPAAGYHFEIWSDGRTQNPRTDSGVTNDITVTASFALNPVVSTGAGALPMTQTSALLRGILTTGVTANAWICWGTVDGGVVSTSDWQHVVSIGAVTEGVAFSNLVTGLSTNSTYFYRCYAANVYDSDWSDTFVAFSGTPVGNSGATWTPSGNITMAAWYDATDAATIKTKTDGSVTNWLDKSGHANQHLSGYISPYISDAPMNGGVINGKNAVHFSGDYMYMSASLTTVRAMFFVANKLNGSDRSTTIAPIIGENSYPGDHTFVLNNNTSYSISVDGQVTNSGAASVSGNLTPTSGGNINLGLSTAAKNGILQWYAQYDQPQSVRYLGLAWVESTSLYYLKGDLGEVILLPAVPSVADRQKVEGYLAWKWGTLANMPAGHPYKTIPPGSVSGIANLVPTGVSHLAATFNAELVAANTNYDVTVYYGTTDGGTNVGSWASSAYVGSWTNVLKSISTTANGLTGGQTYYYTFMASNATSRLWAKPSWKFVMPDTCQLTVNSAHGTAVPAGVTEHLANAIVNVSLSGSPERVGTTQYVCTGWVRTGSAPASGSDLSTSFAMTQDTTVNWTWATNILPVYTVVFDEGEHGSRTGGGELTQEVIEGVAAIAPTITPFTGYQFEGWDTSFDPVTGNLTVHAQYALIQYTVKYLAGIHGSISGPATQIVPHWSSSTEVTAEPDAGGYHFVAWSDGRTDNPRTDSGVTNDITVTATFAFNAPPVLSYGAGSTPVTETSAVLRGVLTSGNSGQAWICWGAADGGTASTSDWDNVVSMGTVTEGVAFSNLVTGLSTNSTYFYRCTASNDYGSDWSDTVATFGGTPVGSGIGVLWTPEGLTMAAWYDAGDTNTITASTNAVSQWRDKSGNAKHVAQATATARPSTGTRTINGLNAIAFDGANDVLTGAANRTDAITIFGVVLVDSGSNTDSARSWLSAPVSSNPDYQMTAPANTDTLGASFVGAAGVSAAAARNSAHIHAAYSWVPNGENGAVRIDGGAASTPIIATASTLQKLATELAIGRQKIGFSARFHDGLVGEIIIINRRLTETDNDFLKIEGYLAHKWGMAANLPTNHPYKVAAPSVSAIANRVPTGISDSAATFNAALNASGTNRDVVVYYGTTDGGTNAGSWAASATVGSWTNVVSTNISYAVSGLTAGTTYYYTFMASNEAGTAWASPSWTFTTPGIPGANRAPVAHAQSVTTSKDTAKAITLTGTDADNDPLTYTVVTQPAHGTLSGTVPNMTYTPAANYSGADSFTFKVNDGTVDSTVVTVSITVTAVNNPPVADAQSVTTAEDTAKAITLTGSDTDNDPLTYIIVTQPAHGTLSGTGSNRTYTPAANYNGADAFTFKVNDGIVDSDVATVSITVTAVNDAPVANAQSVTTAEETATAITLTGSDVEGSTLTYTVVTQPAHGTLSGTAPNVTYTPAANYNGADAFTFKVNDGTVDSAAATVSITVTAVNNAPVANAGADQTVVLDGTSATPWTPTNITLAAWYDAADTNTITLAGSKVSAWATKAGSTRTLVQTTDANRPLYVDNSYIQFDGVNDILTATGFNSTPNVTVFAVSMTYSNDAVADSNKSLLQNLGPTTNPDWWLINPTHADIQGTTVGAGADFPNASSAATRNITHLRAFTSLTATSNGLNRIDGGAAQDELVANGSVMQNGTGRTLTVGRQKTQSTRFFQGRCHEIIIVTARMFPTDANGDYLKLEGYLAHKWGMAANLPADHPYKSAAPTVGSVPTATATLAGSASDSDNDSLTTMWSVVSTVPAGLAPVTFGNASATNTTATFTQAGQYTLRLTANDGTVAVSNEVVITVTTNAVVIPPARTVNGNVLIEWLASVVPASTNDYEAAALADPDNDGFTTAEEYWSGTDPVNSNSFLRIDSVTLEGGNAVLKWQHAAVDPGLPPLAIQTTTNLQSGPWVYTGQKSPVNGTNTWFGAAIPQQLFYRLAVTNAP